MNPFFDDLISAILRSNRHSGYTKKADIEEIVGMLSDILYQEKDWPDRKLLEFMIEHGKQRSKNYDNILPSHLNFDWMKCEKCKNSMNYSFRTKKLFCNCGNQLDPKTKGGWCEIQRVD